jgi:hypothetical protein
MANEKGKEQEQQKERERPKAPDIPPPPREINEESRVREPKLFG